MRSKTTYISVCKQTIAVNRKLPSVKQIGPIRVCVGKHGKPRRNWGMSMRMRDGDIVSICYAHPKAMADPTPMPWGARVWIEVTRK